MSEKKRKSYNIKEKLDIIEKVKSGISKAKIKRDFGIPEGTIRGWVAEEKKLRSFVDKVDETSGLQRKKTRLGSNTSVDDCLYTWFVQKRSEGVPISGPAIKWQAEKFHKDLKLEGDFSASDGWLWRWQKRHGIGEIKISGEARSNDVQGAEQFLKPFQELVQKENYSDEQLYNCDETALYYRMLPSKSLDMKSFPNKAGLKLSKDRVTLLFCTNKTGSHKLLPVCIGKSKNPRCFKNQDMQQLPVVYKNSANAWMTAALFLDWFNNHFVPSVQAYLKKRRLEPKALLLLDNCPAHPPAESLISKDGKVKVLYLPKNTTALIQPLDQGIINAFKVNYRRELIKSLLSSDDEITKFLKSMTLKEVAYVVGIAWNAISNITVMNCWRKVCSATIIPEQTDTEETVEHSTESTLQSVDLNEDEIGQIREILGEPELSGSDVENWINIDKTEAVCKILSDEDIIESVADKSDVNCSSEDEDDDGASAKSSHVPSVREALAGLDTAIQWVEAQRNIEPMKLLHLVSLRREVAMSAKKQQKITDYFKA